MGKLIFKYTDELLEDCREASKIELTVPDDMDIHEFKVMCVRMASALGYQQTSIENSFGDLVWGNEDKDELKELLDGLNIKRTNK
jgi:hypothetical protein